MEGVKQMLKGATSIGVEKAGAHKYTFLEDLTLPVNTTPHLVKLNKKLESDEVRDEMGRSDIIRRPFQRYVSVKCIVYNIFFIFVFDKEFRKHEY